MLNIAVIADLHGHLPVEGLPQAEILVIAGDISPLEKQRNRELMADWLRGTFRPWVESLPYEEVVVIAGNHDFILQKNKWQLYLREFCTYLHNEEKMIHGLKFYGTPYCPDNRGWAFSKEDALLANKWAAIPDDTDVLVVHGPPFGACDYTLSSAYEWMQSQKKYVPRQVRRPVGSRTLRQRLIEVKPSHVLCGHIHEAYGVDKIGQIWVYNASLKDRRYKVKNKPFHLVIPSP